MAPSPSLVHLSTHVVVVCTGPSFAHPCCVSQAHRGRLTGQTDGRTDGQTDRERLGETERQRDRERDGDRDLMQNVLHVRANASQNSLTFAELLRKRWAHVILSRSITYTLVYSPAEAPRRGEGPERQLVAPKQVVSVARVYRVTCEAGCDHIR